MKKTILLLSIFLPLGLHAMKDDDGVNNGKKRKLEEIGIEQNEGHKKAKIIPEVVSKILSQNPYALYEACENCDYETVKKLVDFVDLEAANFFGETLLHIAVYKGRNIEIVKLLIQKGADVDATDNLSHTPLHLAAKYGLEEICIFLVENNANVNSLNEDGDTPLRFAVENGFLGIVKFLVEHEADIEAINYIDENYCTPLLLATGVYPEIAQFLIENDADIHALDDKENTPLHFASYEESPETARMLIEKGAKIDAENIYGETPLINAVNQGRVENVLFLIKKGADVHAVDENKNTTLHLCSAQEGAETARTLIREGVNIQAKNIKGETPIFSAVSKGHIENVLLLLGKGADIHAQSENGDTLLHTAARNYLELDNLSDPEYQRISLFLSRLCDSSIKNIEGLTACDIFYNHYKDTLNRVAKSEHFHKFISSFVFTFSGDPQAKFLRLHKLADEDLQQYFYAQLLRKNIAEGIFYRQIGQGRRPKFKAVQSDSGKIYNYPKKAL